MATIKSFTSLEQSKKLAEILPIESADMFYNEEPEDETYPKDIVDTEYPMILKEGHIRFLEEYGIPCRSLVALLNVLPKGYSLGRRINGKYYVCMTNVKHNISEFDNSIDACVAMIERLHEFKIL